MFFSDPAHTLGMPIIDETGNLYLTSQATWQPVELISLAPDGTTRWRTPTATGAFLSDLSLAPNGEVEAVSTLGFDPAIVKLVAFNATTGAMHDGAAITADIVRSTPACARARIRCPRRSSATSLTRPWPAAPLFARPEVRRVRLTQARPVIR